MTKTAGAILCYLVSTIAGENEAHCELAGLSKAIQKDMEGLSAFLNEDFKCTWKGFSCLPHYV